jgi:hypothetical protein
VEQYKHSQTATLQTLNTLFPEDAIETSVTCVTHCIISIFSLAEPECNPEEDVSDSEELNVRKKKKRLATNPNYLPASMVCVSSSCFFSQQN